MKATLILMLLLSSLSARAGTFDPVKALAERRIPWLSSHLVFEKIAFKDGKDVFELSSSGNKILIAASNVNSAAMGLNWYLQYYCHRSMSHLEDNLSPVYPLPKIEHKVQITAPFQYRYALNYCTFNYTMSFYGWKDWERELDWMALHGVNLMLATMGTEAVWQQTLKKFGFSDQEIKAFIPGPAFNAWWLMGNLEGWGGPVTQYMIDRRTHLEQKILSRMHELGIEPVFQGFYGMVPRALKRHFPKAAIRTQGKWVGAFERPDMLLPEDSLFHRMAKVYYQETRKLYGKDIHFFGGDPFHEGGITQGVDLPRAGKLIQSDMQEVFPQSTWILQGWWENPRKELLEALDKSKVLVLELAGEQSDDWEKRKGFEGTPFLWCTVNNFGEKSGLYGKLQYFADEVNHIKQSEYKNLCKGIGIMPEGIHNNPVVYDLMLELGWHSQKIVVSDWINKYVKYRYGSDNDTLQRAWQILIKTVYRDIPGKEEGLPGDIFCARPAWNIKAVSTGNLKRNYDTRRFEAGVNLFLSAYASMSQSKTYFADAVDFSRQVLANKGDVVYHQMNAAYNQKDTVSFKKYAGLFLSLISLDDSLLSLNKHFRLNTWLDAANAMGRNPYEKALMEKNARIQITYWGPDDPATGLHDYANKEWGGMMHTFYLARWQLFIAYCLKQLRGEFAEPVDYFKFEQAWTRRRHPAPLLRISLNEKRHIMERVSTARQAL